MSTASWQKEFYPIAASKVPAAEATAHSLQKWKGTRPEALAKHGVHFNKYKELVPKDSELVVLVFDGNSCALCRHHLYTGCQTCPILFYKKSIDSNFEFKDEACEQEYGISGGTFDHPGNTQPMIDLLEATLAFEQKQGADKKP